MGTLRWAMLLVALLWPRSALATVVDVTGQRQNVGDQLEIFVDRPTVMTADDAMHATFSPSRALHPNFGFERAPVWARVTLRAPREASFDMILDLGREWIEHVDVWRIDAGRPVHITSTGSRVPLRARDVPVERSAAALTVAGEATYLIRLQTRGPLDVSATLVPRREYLAAQVTGMLFFGGYYAVLLGIAAYSLILFAYLRDRLQAGVAGVLVLYALIEICGHGHLSRLVPAGAGWFEMQGLTLAFAFFCPTITFLARAVLDARSRWLAWAGFSGAALCLAGFFSGWFILALVGALAGVGATLVACLLGLRSHARHARLFALAVGSFALPMTVTLLTLVGWLPSFPANEYGNHAGAVVMSVTLSLLVADSIRLARSQLGARANEVALLNDELRFQVAARSRELVDVLARQGGTRSGETLRVGDLFEARYRVHAFLGRGGAGSVYEVERASDGRRCALKVVTSAHSGTEAARIAREAEIGARIDHANLVRILDVGVARQGPYLVMELVRGGSLDQHRERWADKDWVLRILRGTASGLAALHSARIVHRDLKPPNVLLDGDVPKVADFGIARVNDLSATGVSGFATTVDVDALARSPRLTEAHALMGTPLYMAPESARGANTTSAAGDVFAFGVMAIEMLEQRHPFDELPVLAALSGRPHPEHRSTTRAGEALSRALDACLAANPKERPTIDALLALLDE